MDGRGGADFGEGDEEQPIGGEALLGEAGGGRYGEAGLAHAARTDEGEQLARATAEFGRDVGKLFLAAPERGEVGGEVVERGGGEGVERGRARLDSGGELHCFGGGSQPQGGLQDVATGGVLGERFARPFLAHQGQHHLAVRFFAPRFERDLPRSVFIGAGGVTLG